MFPQRYMLRIMPKIHYTVRSMLFNYVILGADARGANANDTDLLLMQFAEDYHIM